MPWPCGLAFPTLVAKGPPPVRLEVLVGAICPGQNVLDDGPTLTDLIEGTIPFHLETPSLRVVSNRTYIQGLGGPKRKASELWEDPNEGLDGAVGQRPELESS